MAANVPLRTTKNTEAYDPEATMNNNPWTRLVSGIPAIAANFEVGAPEMELWFSRNSGMEPSLEFARGKWDLGAGHFEENHGVELEMDPGWFWIFFCI